MRVKERGFTIMEMLVAMAVMLIVIGGFFQLLNQAQERFTSSSTDEDANALTRDAMDQMVRELRLAGYPPPHSYPAGLINAAANNMQYVAAAGGFLTGASYDVVFEADTNYSGTVNVIEYQLQVPTGGAAGGCAGLTVNAALTTPTLMISRQTKNANGSAVTAVYEPFLENVQNCIQSTPIFKYCVLGAATAGCPDLTALSSSLAAPANTGMVMIDLLVQSSVRDPHTGIFRNIEFFGSAQRLNPDQ